MTVVEMGRRGGYARAAKLRKTDPQRLRDIASAGGQAFAAKCAAIRLQRGGADRV